MEIFSLVVREQRAQTGQAGDRAQRAGVLLQTPMVVAHVRRLRFDQFADAPGAMPARPGARKRKGIAFVSDPIVGRHDKASPRIDDGRHVFKRDQIVPLVRRIQSRAVAALWPVPQRNAAGGLVANIPLDVGEHDRKGRHVPGLERFAKFPAVARSVRPQQGSEPASLTRSKPFEGHRSRAIGRFRQ